MKNNESRTKKMRHTSYASIHNSANISQCVPLRSARAMTNTTAAMINISPATLEESKCSPKYTTPTTTAVSGSIEPRMDVSVEPMRLMANISE